MDEKEKMSFEIQSWLESPPKTLSRLRKFYESIISIHLGGEGIMCQHHNEVLKGTSIKELKKLYQDYKINYPKHK